MRRWRCAFVSEPLNHIHQDTKSARLIALCKHTLNILWVVTDTEPKGICTAKIVTFWKLMKKSSVFCIVLGFQSYICMSFTFIAKNSTNGFSRKLFYWSDLKKLLRMLILMSELTSVVLVQAKYMLYLIKTWEQLVPLVVLKQR